jgi:hypothetical protein
MEKSDVSINVSEETAVSIFRIRIKNVTLCSLTNYSTRISEDRISVIEKWVKLPVSLHRLRSSGSLRSAFRPQYQFKVLARLNRQTYVYVSGGPN